MRHSKDYVAAVLPQWMSPSFPEKEIQAPYLKITGHGFEYADSPAGKMEKQEDCGKKRGGIVFNPGDIDG